MEDLPQKAKSLEPSDLTSSIKKAKAEGKTFEEFVGSQEFVIKDNALFAGKLQYDKPLSEIIVAPKLFEQFPELKNAKVVKGVRNSNFEPA
jgi:hypothetical protein